MFDPISTHPAKELLALRGVSHAFGGACVLRDIGLSLRSGRIESLLGPSGCGKSTLLRLLAGLVPIQRGTRVLAYPKLRIGMCFQEPRLLPWRTVLGNLCLPLQAQGGPMDEQIAQEMLVRVGLGDAGNQYPHELSGGMKMRASVARALITQPNLLLLDEPFAALDEFTRTDLQDLLLDLWRAGNMSVLLVTHSLHEALRVSQRVWVMSAAPGRVVDSLDLASTYKQAQGPGEDWSNSPDFAKAQVQLRQRLALAGEPRG